MPAQPSEPREAAESPGTDPENEGKHAVVPGGNDGDNGNKPDGHRSDIGIEDRHAVEPVPEPAAHRISQAGGGSSPVLPILIAVAVLAALSIGAVLYRQRRHTPVG